MKIFLFSLFGNKPSWSWYLGWLVHHLSSCKEDNLRNEDDLKNEDLKNEDNLKNEYILKN